VPTFSSRFSGTANGSFPTNLVSRWVTPGATTVVNPSTTPVLSDSSFFMTGISTFQRQGFECTQIAGTTSDEIVFQLKGIPDTASSYLFLPLLILRGAGLSASTRSGYFLFARPGTNNFDVRRLNSGSSVTQSSGTLPARVFNQGVVWFKLSVVDDPGGVRVRVWTWLDGESIPAPTYDYIDASPLPVGWAGLGCVSQDNTRTTEVGFYGIGTAGDTAPLTVTPALPTSIVTLEEGRTKALVDWREGV